MVSRTQTINFLRVAFPFALTLFLWRGALSWLNPAGILALVPIFFCTFVRPVKWFAPFALLMCFVLDYRMGTVLYWTSVFCLCYAANGFQTRFDLTGADRDAFGVFAAFISITIAVLTVAHVTGVLIVLRAIWTILWTIAMYLPIVYIIKKVDHD